MKLIKSNHVLLKCDNSIMHTILSCTNGKLTDVCQFLTLWSEQLWWWWLFPHMQGFWEND